ncbi:hypothetical protein [Nocardia sp. NPDC050718]|uniref:hypothetical protein n=1 Tax=Nocardia sp. NPDC050718 TaxID=3155788 RepID=UPI0033E8FDB8
MPSDHEVGLLDTNIMILRRWIDPAHLPDAIAISTVTLSELSAGAHEVRRDDEQDQEPARTSGPDFRVVRTEYSFLLK